MANSYATERWLRQRLREHDVALRMCRECLQRMLDDEPVSTREIERAHAEAEEALHNASPRKGATL